jgi:hypothetical protein
VGDDEAAGWRRAQGVRESQPTAGAPVALMGRDQDRIHMMITDPNTLLFDLRDRGRVVSVLKMGETVYELDGRLYRAFLVPEKDRRPGEGPWRVEEVA